MELPNPRDLSLPGNRLLSDTGILQAFREGYFRSETQITPESKSLQPASLDVHFDSVVETESFDESSLDFPKNSCVVPPHLLSTVRIQETIELGTVELPIPYWGLEHATPSSFAVEARSSVRRLGPYVPAGLSGLHYDMVDGKTRLNIGFGNTSPNPIHFEPGEAIAQILFFIDPARFAIHASLGDNAAKREQERLFALDMAVPISSREQAEILVKTGDLAVGPRGPRFSRDGYLLVHAGTMGQRFQVINDGIHFSRRDSLRRDDILEPVSLANGAVVGPGDHLIIDTQERLELSDRVGIWFRDHITGISPSLTRQSRSVLDDYVGNERLSGMPDGWIDPGYKGGFSRQPKCLTRRSIATGDVIGVGQLFFFPNGVRRAYGSAQLGSQYQGKQQTAFAK